MESAVGYNRNCKITDNRARFTFVLLYHPPTRPSLCFYAEGSNVFLETPHAHRDESLSLS